jgi:hypothetical protein
VLRSGQKIVVVACFRNHQTPQNAQKTLLNAQKRPTTPKNARFGRFWSVVKKKFWSVAKKKRTFWSVAKKNILERRKKKNTVKLFSGQMVTLKCRIGVSGQIHWQVEYLT